MLWQLRGSDAADGAYTHAAWQLGSSICFFLMACVERCIARVDDGLAPFHCVPNALAPPGVWQSRLSDTAGPPGGPSRCIYTHACWCLAAGDVAARVPGNTEAARLLDCCCGGVVGCAVCAYCMFWGVTRTRLRHAYNIPGSPVVDHIIVTLFPTCYLTQALNHLDIVRAFLTSRCGTQLLITPPAPVSLQVGARSGYDVAAQPKPQAVMYR